MCGSARAPTFTPSARVDGPCVIGHDCRIGAGAHLAPYTVLGDNVRVGSDAYIERSVVHDNSHLGRAVRLRGTIVGRRGDLRYGARCEEDVVLGDECFVGEHAVINQGVKVYPFKTVEPGAVVNASLVWESRGARSLFGRDGVTGLANVDLSPELALRVAMAFATGIKKGSWVTTSRDSSRAGRVLKRAVMVGLNAAGLNVDDLELATAPLARFHARNHRHAGSITVRLSADDPEKVSMRFFDADGIDLAEGDQRKIERLYHREDFRRVVAGEIGDIGFAPRAIEHYTAALIDTVDWGAMARAATQDRARPRVRRDQPRAAERAGQGRRRRARRESVHGDIGGRDLRRRGARRRTSPASCGPRALTSARCFHPTASESCSSTISATCCPASRRN